METILVKRTGLFWLWLSVFVLITDQVAKYIASHYLLFNESFYLLPFFNLTLAHNKGAAFSFLSESGIFATWLFIATALIISSLLSVWLHRVPKNNIWLSVALALILGGAIGNLLDRILYGYVIDFIHLHLKSWSWPIFNIADMAITCGALMLIVDLFKEKAK